jgi:cyclopropane-fatty-acyl-phospholipid synthase
MNRWFNDFALLDNLMRRFVKIGTLRIIDAFGRLHVYAATSEPSVTVKLTDARLHRALLLNPELRAGEAYMDETLVFEQGTLRDFLQLYALNGKNLRSHPLQKAVRKTYKALRHFHQRNPIARSKANVGHHYDLSNELYTLFLDEGLNYSCAFFDSANDTIETAQQNKLRLVASKLLLRPGLKVLDIGSGWGALAMHLAEEHKVEVTGITLSAEQHALAAERARMRGLSGRVNFEIKDYREVRGKFDRIVSVGMFEHVGVTHYGEFFSKISELLEDSGVALLHSIGRMGGPGPTNSWIRKYIFPGASSPALSETMAAIENAKLWVTDVEILRLHYAETLRAWEDRFQANRKRVAELLGERFCRMWEFYLIVSEFSFRYGQHMVFQIQLSKTVDAVPLNRNYRGSTKDSFRGTQQVLPVPDSIQRSASLKGLTV